MAQQQVVEVVKARSLDARIVVMDEPTRRWPARRPRPF